MTAFARAILPGALLGAMCGGAVRILSESSARHPGALWLPTTDLDVVLLIAALLVAMSAVVVGRLNRAATSGSAWRGAVLTWPALVVAAAVVAGPVWTAYVLGLPLLIVLIVGVLATRPVTAASSSALGDGAAK